MPQGSLCVGSAARPCPNPFLSRRTHLRALPQPDLQHPAAEGDAGPAAELQRKSKKRKSTSDTQPRKKVPPRDALGEHP